MSLFLATTSFSQLINEDFEGSSPPDLPMGWTGILDAPGGDYLYTTIDGTNTMVTFFRQSESEEIPIILVSPQVELSQADELNFDVLFGQMFIDELAISIGSLTDPSDYNTYTEFTQFAIPDTWTEWETLNVDFSTYTGTDEYLGFKFLGEDQYNYFHLDNVILTEGSGGLLDNDLAVTIVTEPVSGTDLTSAEPITITIKNAGNNPQSNFDVSYTIDGGDLVTETVSSTLNSLESIDYTFTATADLSEYGMYSFEACSVLDGDENVENDCASKDVENTEPFLCLEGLYVDGCDYGDGLISWDLTDVNIPEIACDGDPINWYHDYTNLTHSFVAGEEYTLTVEAGYEDTYLDVWIDLNDDLFLDDDEHILNNALCNENGVISEFTVMIPADAVGQHLLRYRTNYESVVEGSCDVLYYGNMCDFTASIVITSIKDLIFNNTEVYPNPANGIVHIQSDLQIKTISVYNHAGQLIDTKIVNASLSNFNSSNYISGLYLFKIETEKGTVLKRIIIQ